MEQAAGSHSRRAAGLRRLIRLAVGALLLGYIVLLGFFAFMQDSLIFPGRATQGQKASVVTPPPGAELIRLKTARGDSIAALFGPALPAARGESKPLPDAAQRPTLLFFYGNGQCMSDLLPDFMELRRLGANVLMADYAGYGMSAGRASEANCCATADALYDHLQTRQDCDPRKIVAVGWSLGGAVAIDLASRKPLAGLAAFSTFTSLPDMARQMGNVPFVTVVLRHRFESERKMARVACPVLIGHGAKDAMVPAAMSARLAFATSAPVTRFSVPNAGHNDFFSTGQEQVAAALRAFLQNVQPIEK